MAAGIKTPAFDGVGYDVGATPVAPAGGFFGLVDFVGYPVGEPVPSGPPEGGFLGLLDFAGYPVGLPPGVIPPEPPTGPSAPGGSIPIAIDPVTWAHEVTWCYRVDWRSESRLRTRGRAPAPTTRKRETSLAPVPLGTVALAAEPITWSARGATLAVRLELRGAVTFRSRRDAIVTDDEELFELGIFDDGEE